MDSQDTQREELLVVGEHECVTCQRCACTFAAVHPACPRCSSEARLVAAETRQTELREALEQVPLMIEAHKAGHGTLTAIVLHVERSLALAGSGSPAGVSAEEEAGPTT